MDEDLSRYCSAWHPTSSHFSARSIAQRTQRYVSITRPSARPMRLRSCWHFRPDDAGCEKQADDCEEGDRIDVLPMAPLVLLQPVMPLSLRQNNAFGPSFGQQLRELNLTPMPVSGPRNSNLRLCLTLARKRMALPTESDHSGRRLGSENLI